MSTFVIGDIHGCYRTLKSLLKKASFDPRVDHVWLVGDLVNGGPASLDVLRWVVDLEDRARVVLGNHDLYLLGRILGVVDRKRRDTLDPVLQCEELPAWKEWLLHRPLLVQGQGAVMVHAGLPPAWDLKRAVESARRAEEALRENPRGFLESLFQGSARGGQERGPAQEAHTARILTRIRTCRPDGSLCLGYTGPPGQAPKGCLPWYQRRPAQGPTLFFGHWAAHGFRQWDNYTCMDSGCVWGQKLTALQLESGEVFQESNRDRIRSR